MPDLQIMDFNKSSFLKSRSPPKTLTAHPKFHPKFHFSVQRSYFPLKVETIAQDLAHQVHGDLRLLGPNPQCCDSLMDQHLQPIEGDGPCLFRQVEEASGVGDVDQVVGDRA
jgi:hypothetical protein